ncbi:MAG TPA: hypothetical protein VN688_21920 [Gemmataceae bacterium]|nr:hypothetical protein [Gemmataceae bacterium]
MAGWDKSRLFDAAWLLFWIVASSVSCVVAAARLSATFDEPTYINCGLESWHTGSSKRLLDLGTMPLPPHVQTLPIHLWECWRGETFDPVRDLDRLLPVARMGTLPFWWLLLLYGWRAGRQMAGMWGGRLAVALLACEPNLLAHTGLATTDIAVSACLLALLVHFRAGRDGPWLSRVLVPAIWFALAVLSKASGLVFGVIGLSMVELEYRLTTTAETEDWWPRLRAALVALVQRPFRRDLLQIYTLAGIGVFCYCGSDWLVSPSFVAWARQLPEGPASSVMVWFAEHLRIFSNAGVALVRQMRHNVQGHGVFLLDHVERRAIWYYFPLAISIKSPLPLLVLPLLLAAICRRALRNWACIAALALLMFSLVCRVQTGIRLLLPLVSLAVVGLAAALVTARQQLAESRLRPLLTTSCLLSAGWLLWASLSVWPHALCYTNELWGGTSNGYRCLSDSNYDWGQGLKELAQWQDAHQVRDLHVLYYGTDTSLRQLPMQPLTVGALQLGPEGLPERAQGGILAVATSILYGSVSKDYPDLQELTRSLQHLTPVDRTTTFLIYRIPAKSANSVQCSVFSVQCSVKSD